MTDILALQFRANRAGYVHGPRSREAIKAQALLEQAVLDEMKRIKYKPRVRVPAETVRYAHQ